MQETLEQKIEAAEKKAIKASLDYMAYLAKQARRIAREIEIAEASHKKLLD